MLRGESTERFLKTAVLSHNRKSRPYDRGPAWRLSESSTVEISLNRSGIGGGKPHAHKKARWKLKGVWSYTPVSPRIPLNSVKGR